MALVFYGAVFGARTRPACPRPTSYIRPASRTPKFHLQAEDPTPVTMRSLVGCFGAHSMGKSAPTLYRALHDGRPVFWCWRVLANSVTV